MKLVKCCKHCLYAQRNSAWMTAYYFQATLMCSVYLQLPTQGWMQTLLYFMNSSLSSTLGSVVTSLSVTMQQTHPRLMQVISAPGVLEGSVTFA